MKEDNVVQILLVPAAVLCNHIHRTMKFEEEVRGEDRDQERRDQGRRLQRGADEGPGDQGGGSARYPHPLRGRSEPGHPDSDIGYAGALGCFYARRLSIPEFELVQVRLRKF